MPTLHQKHAPSARWVALTDTFKRLRKLKPPRHFPLLITPFNGIIDDSLASANVQAQMDFNQMIALQRSQHMQKMEILQFLDKKKFDGLHQVVTALSQQEVDQQGCAIMEANGDSRSCGDQITEALLGHVLTFS